MRTSRRLRLVLAFLAAVALAPVAARATHTDFWQVSTFRGFLQGTLQGVSVSMNGELTLAPGTDAIFNPNETVALSVVADRNGNLYIGTGHQGKVFKVNREREGKLLFQAPEPEILSLAVGPDGDLYVGTAPEGKIYRVTPDGKSSVFFEPKAKYIWALAFDSEGRLYAGTGDSGEIFRIDRSGKGGVFFASNQTHIMCLAFDRSGNLLAGSEPNGLIYRISPAGKAFVLYQSNLPEIHSLVTDSEGRIYAAALGNAATEAVPGYFGAPTPRPASPDGTATVTVVATDEANAPSGPQMPVRRQRAPRPNANASAGVEFPYSRVGAGRGALVEIMPDSSAQTLWQSSRASIFGLALRGGDVLFSTDDDGRIFDLKPSPTGPELTLLTETRESLPTRILADGSGLFVATSNIAKLIRVGSGYGADGVYESPVKDARFISRWGHISWRAQAPAGGSLEFYTRSGNSARPDNTWSNWAGPYKVALGSPIESPAARYIQWKAIFHGADGASPALGEVEVSYLNQNLPPEIESLTVVDGTERTSMSGVPIESPGVPLNSTPVPAVTTTIVQPSYASVGPVSDPPAKQPIEIEWQASDPNHDTLAYSLYIKSASEKEWHLLKDKLGTPQYTLEPDSLADGEYRVRLVASDAPSNPAGQALAAELVSAPFWVDNTPPQVVATHTAVTGRAAVIQFEATSKGAPIRSAQVSSGEAGWKDVVSDDGIVDSRDERFTIRLHDLGSGEHVVSLRAYDTAGNVGVATAVVDVR